MPIPADTAVPGGAVSSGPTIVPRPIDGVHFGGSADASGALGSHNIGGDFLPGRAGV